MRKLLSSLFFLFTFLTACSPSPASTVTPSTPIPSIIIPTPPACTALQVEPTPGAETPSLFPPESEADHARGADNPLLTITEYSDYQDLRSGLLAGALDRLLEEQAAEVRVVSRLFPLLAVNDKAALAAQAAEAAFGAGTGTGVANDTDRVRDAGHESDRSAVHDLDRGRRDSVTSRACEGKAGDRRAHLAGPIPGSVHDRPGDP